MKQCGILTFQFAHNYGALLQAYAIKRFLHENRIEAEIINYANDEMRKMYALHQPKDTNILVTARHMKNSILRYKQFKLFEKFSEAFLDLQLDIPLSNPKIFSRVYDNIIVGSDQVWNKKLTHYDRTYFLDGVDCLNSISYAASFGGDANIDLLDANDFALLNRFNAISLREISATKKLKEKISREVYNVCDPVFLVGKDTWKKIERKPRSISRPYVCIVMLKNDPELNSKCNEIFKDCDYEFVSIHPMAWKQQIGRQLYDVGPLEFLWIIDHAECIITNSFHASAFSVIMGKKLIYNCIEKGNNRISSLMENIGLKAGELVLVDTKSSDWHLLQKQIKYSKQFILKNLLYREGSECEIFQ